MPRKRDDLGGYPIQNFLPWERGEELRTRKYLSDCFHFFPAARVRGKRSENFSSGERKKENDVETSGTPQVPAELGGRHVETKLSPWKPSRSQLDRTVNVAGRGSC